MKKKMKKMKKMLEKMGIKIHVGKGLICPLCGSWYTDDPESVVFWRHGEVCNNMAMTGPHPEKCSPKHPCRGRLVFCGDDDLLSEDVKQWQEGLREMRKARRMP